MSTVFAILAGCLGMLIAVVHGVLGATKVVGPIQDIPESSKRVLHAIFFLSAVYWFIGGAILVAAALYPSFGHLYLVAPIVAVLYFSGAVANFWATRGRHFGWMLLSIAAALAMLSTL